MKNHLNSQFPFLLFQKYNPRYLSVLLLIILSSYVTYAQSNFPDCSQLAVEVAPIQSTLPTCAGTGNCGKIYYQVSLITRNGFTRTDSEFKLPYNTLSIPIALSIDNPSSGGLSRVDVMTTMACYAQTDYSSFPLSVENLNGDETVTFFLTDDPNIGVTPPDLTLIKQANNDFRAKLFVVAVDAFAGETISLTALSPVYTRTTPSLLICSPLYAAGEITTVPQPAASETQVCLQFGTFDPVSKKLPVQIHNGNAGSVTLDQLTFSLRLETNNLMENPVYKDQAFNLNPLTPIPGANPNLVDWQGKVFYNPSMNPIMIPGNATFTLFSIELVGPVNTSEAASVNVAFGDAGVINTTLAGVSSGCKDICSGADATMTYGGYEACTEGDFKFRVVAQEAGNTDGQCPTLQVMVQLEWGPAYNEGEDVSFDAVHFKAEFDLPPGVSISSTPITDNEFTCPNNTVCGSGFTDCFKIDGNELTFCYTPGMPQNISNGTSFTVNFSAPEGCIGGLVIREAYIDLAGQDPCVPELSIEEFPLCPPRISGSVLDELGQVAPNVQVKIANSDCGSYSDEPTAGFFSRCGCRSDVGYTVTPIPDNNDWTNGVTTYDLVLISKHILGLQPFDSPYKIIAADANRDGSINTFDNVELRKLILGFYSSLPANDSWRYIDADFIFSNPTNPWASPFPDDWTGSAPNSNIDFIAVKIGDVNNSHTNDGPPGMMRQATLPVGIGQPSHRAGEFFTFPVSYEGAEALAAIQLGLQFDADHWELLEPSTAGLPDFEPGCFNLREAEKGRIKFVWYTPREKEQLQKGRTLFYLTFRRKTAPEVPLMLRTDDGILDNTGFSDSGQAYALVATEAFEPRSDVAGTAAPLAWTVRCAPNPVTDVARFQVESPSAKAVSVWVFNALGIRTYYRELSIPAGTTELSIPEVAQWPAGIYTWKVKAGKEKRQGQFVKR